MNMIDHICTAIVAVYALAYLSRWLFGSVRAKAMASVYAERRRHLRERAGLRKST